MNTRSDALRLADELEEAAGEYWRFQKSTGYGAAAELRRQHGEIKSMQAERLRSERRLLDVKAQRDALLEALRALVRNEGLDAYSYLDKGIGTATAAGKRWLNARAAIKTVEGARDD